MNTYLSISLSDSQVLSHVHVGGEDLVLLGIDNGEGVDGDEDLITFTVNPDCIVEVLELIIRCELNVDVLCDAAGDHALFVVLDFEKGGLRGKDVETLRGWRVIDQPHF